MADGDDTMRGRASVTALKAPPRSITKTKDLLSFYMAEVRKHPILTPEEEHEYAVRFREEGDREAAEKLVTSNLRLVIKIAFQYHRQWANVLDLIQEGNVGLVEALTRYDPYRDVRFSTYAQHWIKAMIRRFLLDNIRLVRFGSTRAGRKLYYQLNKERDRLIAEGLPPTPRLIAERLGVKESEVHLVDAQLRAPAMSLDSPAGDEGRPLGETVAAPEARSPEDEAARLEMGSRLKVTLGAFADALVDERERIIWTERLISNDPASLASLGTRFGVSKERVRQLEARMKKRLKAHIEKEHGEIDFEFDVPE